MSLINAGAVLGGRETARRDTQINLAAKPWRVCATRGNFYYTGDGSAGQTRFESYIKVAICKGGVSALRFVFANKVSGDEGEINTLLSPYTLECSVTIGGTTLIPVMFNGRKNPVVDVDTPFLISDPIGIELAEGQIIEIRTGAIITTGGRVPVGLRSGGSATVKVRSSAVVSQIYTTAAMTTPAGGVAQSNGFVPVAVLGKMATDTPSVLIFGDSQLVGIGDSSDFNTGLFGGLERALAAKLIGFSNCARGGDKSGAYSAVTNTSRLALLPYVTHCYANMGLNDVGAARTVASVLANVDSLIGKCQKAGVKLVYESPFVTTTSTDSWATLANQTVTAGFELGGLRDQIITGLKARCDQGLLTYIDAASVLIDPATNKWLVGMTDDGTHPSATGHLARSTYIQANFADIA